MKKKMFSLSVCSSTWTEEHTLTHPHTQAQNSHTKMQTGLWLTTRDASASSIRLKIEWFRSAANRRMGIGSGWFD